MPPEELEAFCRDSSRNPLPPLFLNFTQKKEGVTVVAKQCTKITDGLHYLGRWGIGQPYQQNFTLDNFNQPTHKIEQKSNVAPLALYEKVEYICTRIEIYLPRMLEKLIELVEKGCCIKYLFLLHIHLVDLIKIFLFKIKVLWSICGISISGTRYYFFYGIESSS